MKNKLLIAAMSIVFLAACSTEDASNGDPYIESTESSQQESSEENTASSDEASESSDTETTSEAESEETEETSTEESTASGSSETAGSQTGGVDLAALGQVSIDTTFPGSDQASSITLQETGDGVGTLTVNGPFQATYNVTIRETSPQTVNYYGMGDPSLYSDTVDTEVLIADGENDRGFGPIYLTLVQDSSGQTQVKAILPILMTMNEEDVDPEYHGAYTYRLSAAF